MHAGMTDCMIDKIMCDGLRSHNRISCLRFRKLYNYTYNYMLEIG